MFDLFESLLFGTPEKQVPVSDIIVGRDRGLYEAVLATSIAIEAMEADGRETRMRQIAEQSDALVDPTIISKAETSAETNTDVEQIVQKMTTGYGPNDIDLHSPDTALDTSIFEGEERRNQIAQMTEARARLNNAYSGSDIPEAPLENTFEVLPSDPTIRGTKTVTVDNSELSRIRATLEDLYSNKQGDLTDDRFGLAA